MKYTPVSHIKSVDDVKTFFHYLVHGFPLDSITLLEKLVELGLIDVERKLLYQHQVDETLH